MHSQFATNMFNQSRWKAKSWWLLWAPVPLHGTSGAAFQSWLQASQGSTQNWILVPKGGGWNELAWVGRFAALGWQKRLSLLGTACCPSTAPAPLGTAGWAVLLLGVPHASLGALELNTPLSPPALNTGTRSGFPCPSVSEMSARGGSSITGHGAGLVHWGIPNADLLSPSF